MVQCCFCLHFNKIELQNQGNSLIVLLKRGEQKKQKTKQMQEQQQQQKQLQQIAIRILFLQDYF